MKREPSGRGKVGARLRLRFIRPEGAADEKWVLEVVQLLAKKGGSESDF